MSAIERLAKCPYWPARLTADTAAMFMGMSLGKFLTRYRHLGRDDGGNVYYSTRQLQELVDADFALAPIAGPAIAAPEDLAAAAEQAFFERRGRDKS